MAASARDWLGLGRFRLSSTPLEDTLDGVDGARGGRPGRAIGDLWPMQTTTSELPAMLLICPLTAAAQGP